MKKNNLIYIILLGISIFVPFGYNLSAQSSGFTVAKDGSGDFTTVQAAIDAAPSNSENRTEIFIKSGTYYELINVSSSKTNLSFIGEDVDNTIITYDNGAKTINPATGNKYGTTGSTSIVIRGAGFFATNISLQNNADKSLGQAVAVKNQADKSIFKNVKFLGNQDTYYPDGGRSYYENCYFEGTTDFIFGGGTAFFENCQIYSKGGTSITASRTPENVEFGFVFHNCTVTGAKANNTDLGRPWRPYACVTFLNCSLSDAIKPEGWNNWRNASNESTARFAEYNNTGPGSNLTNRVSWMKKLTDSEALEYNVLNVLKATNANPQVIDNWSPFDVLGGYASDISVTLTSPTDKSGFPENASITLEADASISDGLIENVKFYADTLLHVDTTAPYSYTWENVESGVYNLLATATDTGGYTGYSKRITAFVGSGIVISSPVDGAKIKVPDVVKIEANAWNNDGTISKVEFFEGENLLGTDSTQPYSYTWENAPTGSYIITAKATDNENNVITSEEIAIKVAGGPEGFDYCSKEDETCVVEGIATVAYGADGKFNYKHNVSGSIECSGDIFGDPIYGTVKACYVQLITVPIVSITSPTVDSSYQAPAEITILVNAIDQDGKIDSVEYYQNDTYIGVSTVEPFSYIWENVNGGTYNITAKATDNDGQSTTTDAVEVTVAYPTSIGDLEDNVMTLYPNPVTDKLTLKLNSDYSDYTHITLFNNQGRNIIQKNISSNELVLDLSNLPSGIYVLSLSTKNKEVLTRKIIKN